MIVHRITVSFLLTMSTTWFIASCSGIGAGSNAKGSEIDSSLVASEAMMLAFRDSVRGVSEEERARRTREALAVHAPDSLEACSYQIPAPAIARHTTETFTLELPADFKLTEDGDIDRTEKHYGYGKYVFTGSDGSTVTIDGANNDQAHSYWSGSISSECDLDIGPHQAHIDVANASINSEDRIVHAHFYLSPRLALMFVAHAKSRPRQAELLSAVHTLRVRPAWGVTN